MNKVKFRSIFVILMVMLMLAGCSKGDSVKNNPDTGDEEIIHSEVDAKTDCYYSLEELENAVDVIIKGVRLEKEEAVIAKTGKGVLYAYTFSELKVTDVYKNSASQLAEGDVITILENEAYDKDTKTVYHVAGYDMMVEGNEYLLLLKENELDGKTYYVSAAVNFGTVSLNDDGRNDDASMDYSAYESIWQAAKEKYK